MLVQKFSSDKCKVSDSWVRVDIQKKDRKGQLTRCVAACMLWFLHVKLGMCVNRNSALPCVCFQSSAHMCVHACAWLDIDKKGTADPEVGQHPLEYTFPTLSGRNMHNDTVVNIPTKACPAAEQFTGNIWPCLLIAAGLGGVLHDCLFLIKLPNYLLGMWATSSGVQTSPKCSNVVPLGH